MPPVFESLSKRYWAKAAFFFATIPGLKPGASTGDSHINHPVTPLASAERGLRQQSLSAAKLTASRLVYLYRQRTGGLSVVCF
jgi:hypothetical protein